MKDPGVEEDCILCDRHGHGVAVVTYCKKAVHMLPR